MPTPKGSAQPPTQIGLVGEDRPSSWTDHMLDWIALADPKVLPDPSVRLYWLLKSFIIHTKGQDPDPVVQIVQEDLADMLHRSVDSIQRALKPLYAAGLVEDKARRKVSERVPGKKKPVVTTLLIMQVNEAQPPADWPGWVTPFQARKDVRARRAAAEEAAKRSRESAGQRDTADLRPHSDQPTVDNPPTTPAAAVEDVSPGQCDTANLPETGADLRQNEADLRCIGSNPSGTQLSGTKTGGRDAAPQTPASRDPLPNLLGGSSTELEFEGDPPYVRARDSGPRPEARLPGSVSVDELAAMLTAEDPGLTHQEAVTGAYRIIAGGRPGGGARAAQRPRGGRTRQRR